MHQGEGHCRDSNVFSRFTTLQTVKSFNLTDKHASSSDLTTSSCLNDFTNSYMDMVEV